MVQEDCFVNEKNEKLKTLGVFKNESGILRLKTKLTFREDTEEFKMPAVLSSNHEVVKRLMRYYNKKNAHAVTQILNNILRERFWILNARKTVKSLINQCAVCRRFSAKNLETCTALPPEDKTTKSSCIRNLWCGPCWTSDFEREHETLDLFIQLRCLQGSPFRVGWMRYFNPNSGVQVLLDFKSVACETYEILPNHIFSILLLNDLNNKVVGFRGDNCNTNFGGVKRAGKNNVFHRLKYSLGRKEYLQKSR
ncbi:hypothetical protein X975_02488, partial [Stegodyphus mimosarum]